MRLETPLDDLFRGPSHVRVLRALHQLPAGFSASAREIARRAGVSHPTASKALVSLADQGLVTRSRAPRASSFQLRRSHTAVEELIALFRWEEGLRQELIALLRTELLRHGSGSVTAAYLFGSAAAGDMTATSDIDLAVLHRAGASEKVRVAMEAVGDSVQERFGSRLSLLVTDIPVEELQRSGREGSRLWRQILREGTPILDSESGSADG